MKNDGGDIAAMQNIICQSMPLIRPVSGSRFAVTAVSTQLRQRTDASNDGFLFAQPEKLRYRKTIRMVVSSLNPSVIWFHILIVSRSSLLLRR